MWRVCWLRSSTAQASITSFDEFNASCSITFLIWTPITNTRPSPSVMDRNKYLPISSTMQCAIALVCLLVATEPRSSLFLYNRKKVYIYIDVLLFEFFSALPFLHIFLIRRQCNVRLPCPMIPFLEVQYMHEILCIYYIIYLLCWGREECEFDRSTDYIVDYFSGTFASYICTCTQQTCKYNIRRYI